MRSFLLNKLVKDSVFEQMQQLGQKITYHTLDDETFTKALKDKLVEEARELQAASPEEATKELKDVQLVLDTLKNTEHSPFSKGIFVERLDLDDDDPWVEYYASEPERFTEVSQGALLKVYVAGKVSKESHFGKHDWRDQFVNELATLSDRKLINLDPIKIGVSAADTAAVFQADAYMISRCDVFIVYLSDDISIGGSQEILLAKYFSKPVIGLAPKGGKFNGSTKEYFGETVTNYKDPFVFSTCDVVCDDSKAVAKALISIESITPKSIDIIGESAAYFKKYGLPENAYLRPLLTEK